MSIENARRMNAKYSNDVCVPSFIDVILEGENEDVPEKYYRKAFRGKGIEEEVLADFDLEIRDEFRLQDLASEIDSPALFWALYKLVELAGGDGEFVAIVTVWKDKSGGHIKLLGKGAVPYKLRIWDVFDFPNGREFGYTEFGVNDYLNTFLSWPTDKDEVGEIMIFVLGSNVIM